MTIKHYLISINLNAPFRMHGYVMTDDRRYVTHLMNEMVDWADQNKLPVWPPIVLITELSPQKDKQYIKLVRKIMEDEGGQQAQDCLMEATDFVRIGLTVRVDSPNDKRLMELH